ncbi:MAG TPA: hypothetical protein VG186_07350 [Solirubrobacteraceae bacterium]|jgi:hypothetical protein|nr:hypothetical protein [Solirubrobacteraceae bacterium]
MSWPSSPRPRHAAAVLAAVLVLALGVTLIATSGGGSGAKAARARVTSTAPFPHTPGGAGAAVAAWMRDFGTAFVSGNSASAVRAWVIPPFRARVEGVQRVSALAQARIASLHEPFALREWPLGYAIEEYGSTTARVRVFEFGVIAWGHFAERAFDTRIVSLQWTAGGWKVSDSRPGPDLTPPGASASAAQIANWITAVDELKSYTDAP